MLRSNQIMLLGVILLASASSLSATTGMKNKEGAKTSSVLVKKSSTAKDSSQKNVIKQMPQGTPIVVDVDKFEDLTQKPKVTYKTTAAYPEDAIKKGLEGEVIVKVTIDTTGKVEKAEVVKSTNKIFNEPAIKAAMKFKFTPAMIGKKKVKVSMNIPFEFKLNKKDKNK